MAGQGTVALEFLASHPDLDLILCPVGGGGLLSGTAVVAKSLSPMTRVIGTEPSAADDAAQSFHTGQLIRPTATPQTIADGLRGALGDLTFSVIREFADDIITTDEAAIAETTHLLQRTFSDSIEPSSAVPLAALLSGSIPDTKDQSIGIILTGGNVDA